MTIHFEKQRWEQVRENAAAWWAGTLKRPLIQMTLTDAPPDRPPARLPCHQFTATYGLDAAAGDIVDAWDYHLSTQRYLGDGFPVLWPNFGPGVVAAFLGARLEPRADTVWFHRPAETPIEDLTLPFRDDSPWLARVIEICATARARWDGNVQVGMTDLGGLIDILSTFRPSEELLTDLCLHPDHVKRLAAELHDRWWQYFRMIDEVLRPGNPGYTAWAPIFSATPYYILQCDFCYMVGPDMFDEFVKPELTRSCRKLDHAFYHLDGPGQLAHLDSLLKIEELKGVQWVPGAGKPDHTQWPQVYRKIRDAGKLIQLWGGMRELNALLEQLGSLEGIVIFSNAAYSERASAEEFVAKFG